MLFMLHRLIQEVPYRCPTHHRDTIRPSYSSPSPLHDIQLYTLVTTLPIGNSHLSLTLGLNSTILSFSLTSKFLAKGFSFPPVSSSTQTPNCRCNCSRSANSVCVRCILKKSRRLFAVCVRGTRIWRLNPDVAYRRAISSSGEKPHSRTSSEGRSWDWEWLGKEKVKS
jgi:hypothetical protein